MSASYVNDLEHRDYDLEATPPAWAAQPSHHHRLFLDVYNVTDFYDFETTGAAGLFPSRTLLADTIRPTLTLLWDERWRLQFGAIAARVYGDRPGFGRVDPWIQLLWKPVKSLDVILGNLHTSHYFLPALFYPTYYVENRTYETGMQVMLQKPNWFSDLYFNYYRPDTADHTEKFDWGIVHRNSWRFFNFVYQAHWVHEGGELFVHDYNTVNDVAQAMGLGLQHRLSDPLMVGGNATYMLSHYRLESLDNPHLNRRSNGKGILYELFVRFKRLKAIYGHWEGKDYAHETGDPMYQLPILNLATLRWDILQGREFNLMAEYTGYYIGKNNLNYNRSPKSAFHIQASWQFSIPIFEWTSPVPVPEGSPVPSRWDWGI